MRDWLLLFNFCQILLFFKDLRILFDVYKGFACMYVCTHAARAFLVPVEARRQHQVPGIGIISLCVYWELSPAPLQGQQVLLTSEPSLQSRILSTLN